MTGRSGRATLTRRAIGFAISTAVALASLAATPRPSAAIGGCLTGYYCTSLTLTDAAWTAGSGTVTTADGLINCTVTTGTLSGTCSSDYAWKQSQGSILQVSYTETPDTGSYACDASGCSDPGVPDHYTVNLFENTPATLVLNLALYQVLHRKG